ncbi:MAG: alpha-amylase, partial [Candidatus Eisenbacteria bacterium]|nr:alpha-amylase [Candidatus Eisenbacteria bacterium]
MNSITFLIALHNHQPVGNFDEVIEQAYQDSYLPFLEVLEQFPAIKVGLHNSGCLIDWFTEHRPEYFERLSGLVERGQIEIISGGYYEPILP